MNRRTIPTIRMNNYPKSPNEWNNPELTLFREFEFRNAPDIEVLIRLVKNHVPDRGNHRHLRARLLGILNSMHGEANAEFWHKRKYPITWRIRLCIRNLKQWFHRTMKTEYFRNYVELTRMVDEAINEMA